MPTFSCPLGPKSQVWLKPDGAGPGVIVSVSFEGFQTQPTYWVRWPGSDELTPHYPHELTTQRFEQKCKPRLVFDDETDPEEDE